MQAYVKPAKYHNTPVEVDGIRFDSKAEAARYVQLKALRAAGRILWFTRQPSFLLLGNTRYRPDFMVCVFRAGMGGGRQGRGDKGIQDQEKGLGSALSRL